MCRPSLGGKSPIGPTITNYLHAKKPATSLAGNSGSAGEEEEKKSRQPEKGENRIVKFSPEREM